MLFTSLGISFVKYYAAIAFALMLIAAGAPVGAQDAGRKLYKWTDDQGQVHYGDHVPDEYVNQERHIFNKEGVEVGKIDAQKSPEQTAIEEQKNLAAEERRRRDRNLVTTFGSVEEIERLRDQRLGLLADQIKVATQFLDILHSRLEKLRNDSMRFKPYSEKASAPKLP